MMYLQQFVTQQGEWKEGWNKGTGNLGRSEWETIKGGGGLQNV